MFERVSFFLLKINPNWGTNVLENIKTIMKPGIIIIAVICSLTCIVNKQFKNAILTLIICGLIGCILIDSNKLYDFGEFIIKAIENIGNGEDLIVKE
jgi:hypothetical protein